MPLSPRWKCHVSSVPSLNGLIWYEYKGDEIAWNGKQYLSIGADGAFDTLEQMDKFWDDYERISTPLRNIDSQ